MTTIDDLMELVESGEYLGVCVECDAVVEGVEPDARRYTCPVCGARAVYGAEQGLLEFA